MNLSIENLNIIERPSHRYVGVCYKSTLQITYNFIEGLHFIVGNIYEGGWSLSYALSAGKDKYRNKPKDVETKIFLNNKLCKIEDIRKQSCYLAESKKDNSKSIYRRIELGIKKNKEFKSPNDIIDLLQLGDQTERLKRPLKYTGNFCWIFSLAIGIANGKKIFCFPWLNKREIEVFDVQFEMMSEAIKKIGGILIVPIESKVDFMDDQYKYLYISDPQFRVSNWDILEESQKKIIIDNMIFSDVTICAEKIKRLKVLK